MYQGDINIFEQLYHLEMTSNKRKPIYVEVFDPNPNYDKIREFYNYTEPYKYDELIATRDEVLDDIFDTDFLDNQLF